MAIPPIGDPSRPLHLAIRWLRLTAAFLVLAPFGILIGLHLGNNLILIMAALLYTVPVASLHLAFSFLIIPGRSWAGLVCLIFASLQFILTLSGTFNFAFLVFHLTDLTSHRMKIDLMYIPLAVAILTLFMLGRLLNYLAPWAGASRYVPVEDQRGFEPIMAAPNEPPPVDDGDGLPRL